MRIWEHTLEELAGGQKPQFVTEAPIPPQPFVEWSVVPITANPKYATALLKGGGGFANQVLLELQDGKWVAVGSYVDDTIHIDESVRGQGLAVELMLRCAEHRSLPLTTGFSDAGYRLLKRTHKLAIERALAAGLTVPDKVLKEQAV